jgi:hypothetical protein
MTGQTDVDLTNPPLPLTLAAYFLNTAYQSQPDLPPLAFSDNSSITSLLSLMVQINERMTILQNTMLEAECYAMLSSEKVSLF